MRILILAAATLFALPVVAQTPAQRLLQPAPSTARAMAAGYKALTVCSALHSATAAGGTRALESIEANELVGIYPELDAIVREMPVEVGRNRVSVAWDETMPARVAQYNGAGCVIMPVGWDSPTIGLRVGPPLPEANDLPVRPPQGDAVALGEIMEGAMRNRYGEGVNTTAVLILQDDAVVAERYAEGFGPDVPQRTWSVAKSLAGTLVGAAVQRGEAEVDEPAAIEDWRRPGDPRRRITLDQLLRMSSGLTSDTAGNRTDALYFGGVSIEEQTTTWPLIARPGAQFRYANNDILLAVLAIAPTFEAHPPAELFQRLGMNDTWAETDWRGGYMLSSQVWSTARDLARFGRLYLHDGVVDGERVLPEGWRDYVSRPSGPQPSQGAQGYGATFWLMNRSEGVPPDTISANGNRGQYVIIVPGRNIVIVRRGEDPTGARFDPVAFTRDVLAALD